ncbi:NAD(P)-binding protein [Artomyces pyxidatus]|uniref:NAD(P)-binding protein n=1 Tax=Artomyces pyxidatus TaxID=48021 RepID=A0ACB8SJ87_9AGAM|nr:NAD(P)-binding protein [Artomyces pyxidatus]
MPTVFFLGATGYIGGSLLVVLRERYPELAITALVRNPAHVEKIRATGATVLQGSFADVDIIAEQSYLADFVFNIADADDVSLTAAILKGAKRRVDEGKSKNVLIHTSGVAVFLDGTTEGKYDPNGRIWNDNNEDDIKSITTSTLHGQVDVPILEAAVAGYVENYIICPAAIAGTAHGPINNGSIFFKYVAQALIAMQRIVYVGEGSNQFTIVHIDDVVDLFLRVFERARKGAPPGESPYARYFIASSHGIEWKTILMVVGNELVRRGKLADGTVHSVSLSDLGPSFGFMGSSERLLADRSKALGWNPRPVNLEDYVQADLDVVLNPTL